MFAPPKFITISESVKVLPPSPRYENMYVFEPFNVAVPPILFIKKLPFASRVWNISPAWSVIDNVLEPVASIVTGAVNDPPNCMSEPDIVIPLLAVYVVPPPPPPNGDAVKTFDAVG